jgi:flagellar P-ring protein precursor FlgI
MRRFALAGAIGLGLAAVLGIGLPPAAGASSPARVRDLTIHSGEIPRRLVGYGLVVGLNGTGDRSFGGIGAQNATVHSVVNLLRRFRIEVPPQYMRLRNVAAVLVTGEASPYLRAGGRFEVQVSALGDATSLQGGVLWITPLVSDPDQPPVGTAQGPVLLPLEENGRVIFARRGNGARIPEGGILEIDPAPVLVSEPRLLLRQPDRWAATRVADAINATVGEGTAQVEDPGSIRLAVPADDPARAATLLAAVDTVVVEVEGTARIVIHAKEGTIVAGGDLRVGSAVIHHKGITLSVGGGETGAGAAADAGAAAAGGAETAADTAAGAPGLVQVGARALVQEVAAGLHAAGATPDEIAAIFAALADAGALHAEVLIR